MKKITKVKSHTLGTVLTCEMYPGGTWMGGIEPLGDIMGTSAGPVVAHTYSIDLLRGQVISQQTDPYTHLAHCHYPVEKHKHTHVYAQTHKRKHTPTHTHTHTHTHADDLKSGSITQSS